MVDLVRVSSDVFLACLAHTLTTDMYEIMGLLIGRFYEENGSTVAQVEATLVLQRSDKRKDRVEIPVEQLCNAAEYAEKVGPGMNIIGWYHSHPHITVNPSHVDVRTQGNYQNLDARFIGLIFSAFSKRNDAPPEEANRPGKIDMVCFQEQYGKEKYVPMEIFPVVEICRRPCLQSLLQLPQILLDEEKELFLKARNTLKDELSIFENNCLFGKSLCHIMQQVAAPVLEVLTSIRRRIDEENNRRDFEARTMAIEDNILNQAIQQSYSSRI